jgi:hypothetical protein
MIPNITADLQVKDRLFHLSGEGSLPLVTVQYNADGTETRIVPASRLESADAAQRRLLASIECPNYEVVAVDFSAEPNHPPSAYWIRCRCARTK